MILEAIRAVDQIVGRYKSVAVVLLTVEDMSMTEIGAGYTTAAANTTIDLLNGKVKDEIKFVPAQVI